MPRLQKHSYPKSAGNSSGATDCQNLFVTVQRCRQGKHLIYGTILPIDLIWNDTWKDLGYPLELDG
jgi:hypothetical protein